MTFCFDSQSRTLSNGKSLLLVGRTGTEIKASGEDCGVWLMRVLGMPGSVVIKQSDCSEEGSREELHLSVSRVNCEENHEMRLFPRTCHLALFIKVSDKTREADRLTD